MAVRIGKPAPDFETAAYHKGDIIKIKLSDYRGKWVMLYFYPGDFTFVCPTELTAVANKYQNMKELGAEVLAISVDSPYTHKAWQEVELPRWWRAASPTPCCPT